MQKLEVFLRKAVFLTTLLVFAPAAFSAGIGFTASTFGAPEDSGHIIVSVELSGYDFNRGSVVTYFSVAPGTATLGADFTDPQATLVWTANGIQSFSIPVLLDSTLEPDETILVSLSDCYLQSEADCNDVGIVISRSSATAIIHGQLMEVENLTPNEESVGGALDDSCANATGDLLLRCDELYGSGLSDTQIKEALDAIVPEQVSAQGGVAVDFGFQQLQMVHGRIVSLRQGQGNVSRMSLAGFTMNSFGQSIPIGDIAQSLLVNALGVSDDEGLFSDGSLGIFLKGQIDIGDKKSTDTETGFDVDAKSITLGIDYQFTDHLVLGVASGYGHTNTDFENNGGDMETHSGNFSIYGSYFLPQDFYIDAIFSYAINSYDSSRTISYTGLQASASSDPMGGQFGGSLGFGKDFFVKSFFFSPYVRVEYLRTEIEEYSERGGSGFALRVFEQSIFSLASTVGGQMSYAFSMPWGIVSPGIRFEWRHQFRNDQRNIEAQFIDVASEAASFLTETDDPDRDYFDLGASLAITLPEGRSAFLRYETRLGQDDITNHTVEIAIRMPF